MSGSWLLAITRTIPYLALTLVLMPVQALALMLGSSLALRLPRAYHRWTMRILGFQIIVRGMPSSARPTLFVSNHTSYFDIEVLASLLQTSFIAKAEMSKWPFFGWLAKLQRSVFVDRRPRNVGNHRGEIAARLDAGDQLVLFAEGTTSDGNRVLPFKSALLSVAEEASAEHPLTIQPVSILGTALNSMPLGRSLRPIYAWYGDMRLLPHVWRALSLGRLTVTVEFHPTFSAAGMGRKAIAERCRAAVCAGIDRAISGRYPSMPPTPPQRVGAQATAQEGREIVAA